MAIPMNVFAEYGAVGIIVFLFVMMIMNLIKSQKAQNADLDDIRVHITKIEGNVCLLYTSPSPRDLSTSRMPSSA